MSVGLPDQDRRFVRPSLLAGAIGTAVTLLGVLLDPEVFLRAYLAAFIGWSAVPIGCLALLMMVWLIGGNWRVALYRPLAAGCRTLPLAMLLFLPIALGVTAIYPWAGGAVSLSGFKALYLSGPFFILRTVIYFLIWIGLSTVLLRGNRGQPIVAAVGLILYALTGSLAGVDWAMSLDPTFHSSIYGLIFLVHQMLAGLAFAVVVRSWSAEEARYPSTLGGLLVSGILSWGYVAAMQFIIIWAGDLPEEIAWYQDRTGGIWSAVTAILALSEGVVPFFLLLSPQLRRSPTALGSIALLILAGGFVEAVWLTLPSAEPATPSVVMCVIAVPAAFVAVGGLWIGAFFHNLGRTDQRWTAQAGEAAHG